LGTEVGQEFINEMQPDAVIVATGARPALPFTAGVDRSHVHTAFEILDGRVSLKGKTAVIGGGLVGMEAALFLVERKVSPVVIIEPTDKLGGAVGLRTGWVVRNEVTNHPHIEVRLKTTVEEIRESAIVLQEGGEFKELAVENVVLAVGMRNNNELAETLRAEGALMQLYQVGDCHIPRTLREAIEEGTIAGRRV
jgi:pyruvate/2-oxoglutarate dehydrogenase complex dihydrolipoamide dehydrogenase (E3) component